MRKTDYVLAYLESGHVLRTTEAAEKWGVYRLSSIISNLRDRGYNIEMELKYGRDQYGNPSRWGEYRLIK